MKKALLTSLSFLSLSVFLFSEAAAQDNPDNCLISGSDITVSENTNDACITSASLLGALDLSTPESPLFTLMGSTPDNVIRPKLGDKISWSFLPQAINALDGEEFAIGFEANPGLLMLPNYYSVSHLRNNSSDIKGFEDENESIRARMQRVKFLSQFTVSGAASKSTGDVDMTRYGVGLNFNHDTGSPLFAKGKFADCVIPLNWKNFRDEYKKQINIEVERLKKESPNHSLDDVKTYVTVTAPKNVIDSDWYKNNKVTPPTIDDCVAEHAPWNRTVYGAGLAIYHSDVEAGDPADLMAPDADLPSDQTGYGAWASVALNAGDNNQLTFSARYNDDLVRERMVMEDAMTENVDGWRVGTRFTRSFSEADKAKGGLIRGFIEASYSEEDFGIINDSFTQAGVGVELQLQDNLYFQATIGDTFGSEIDRDTYLSGQFKWSFSKATAK